MTEFEKIEEIRSVIEAIQVLIVRQYLKSEDCKKTQGRCDAILSLTNMVICELDGVGCDLKEKEKTEAENGQS